MASSEQLPSVEGINAPADSVSTEQLSLPVFPEGMTDEEQGLAEDMSQLMLDQIPLPAIAILTADEMFGEDLDNKVENLFLKGFVDETHPIQGEFSARIAAMFDHAGFMEPDCLTLQVLGRKAGFRTEKTEDKIGNYCCAISLGENQIISMNGKENILVPGAMSQIYELTDKRTSYPFIPRNKTLIKFPNGRATLKRKEYRNLMLWAFWAENPIRPKEVNKSQPDLQKAINKLKEEAHAEPSEPKALQDGIVIYDSKEKISE